MANESEARGGADRIDRAAVMIEARRQYQIMGPHKRHKPNKSTTYGDGR
jgi:hypothetical protein